MDFLGQEWRSGFIAIKNTQQLLKLLTKQKQTIAEIDSFAIDDVGYPRHR